jgi:hypothetical protein
MTRLERWLIKRIIRKEVVQGYDHPARIAALFGLVIEAARDEFTEDNHATSRAYLSEWFEHALDA